MAQPLGAPHAPDLCPVQHALRQAVAAPMAAKQRAAAQAVAQAAARRTRVPERLDQANGAPAQQGPGRPPQATARLAQGAQDVEAARQAPQRLAGPRAMVPQSLRAIGHAAPCVDLERGGRRHGTRLAGAIPRHVDTIRPLAPPAPLSETSRERIEHAERVVPTRQATIAGVSGYGRQPVRHLDVAPPASYAVPAQRRPSCSRERVASTRTMTEGTPLRALAERLRPPRCALPVGHKYSFTHICIYVESRRIMPSIVVRSPRC